MTNKYALVGILTIILALVAMCGFSQTKQGWTKDGRTQTWGPVPIYLKTAMGGTAKVMGYVQAFSMDYYQNGTIDKKRGKYWQIYGILDPSHKQIKWEVFHHTDATQPGTNKILH